MSEITKVINELMIKLGQLPLSTLEQNKKIEEAIASTVLGQQTLVNKALKRKQFAVSSIEEPHDRQDRLETLTKERDRLKMNVPELAKHFNEISTRAAMIEVETEKLNAKLKSMEGEISARLKQLDTGVKLYRTLSHIEWEHVSDKHLTGHIAGPNGVRNIDMDIGDPCDTADTLWGLIAGM